MIRLAAFVAVLSLAASAAWAAPAVGAWHGALATPGGTLRVVVKIETAAAGLTGVMLSPDQTAQPVPLANVAAKGDDLGFDVPAIRGRFEGRWDAAKSAWVGQWSQGLSIPLTLDAGDLPPGPTIAGLDGEWRGAIATPAGGQLRLVLHVRTGAYGTLASVDSPDQLAYAIPATGLARDGDKVRFEIPAVRAAWAGTLSQDGKTLSGEFSQGGQSRPLVLALGSPAEARARPQTPKPPFPYRVEEVSVASAPGVTLAGTLTLPEGRGPFPAVVMITGSGAQDRDETILGHKPFAVIADALTRRGVAVLRLDDRGTANSTGDFAKATEADFVVDTQSAVRFLRGRKDIDPARVGLIGHSEGGLIAPRVAAADPKIAFIVLMAGPGVPLLDVLQAQRLALAPGMGMALKDAEKSNAAMTKAVADIRSSKDHAEATARAVADFKAAAPNAPEAALKAQAEMLASPWFRDLIAYDPAPALRLLRIPVLALVGSHDRQVPPEQNIPALKAALKGDPKATVMELPGLNHLFQTAPTGAAGEYADIEETIAPSALKLIADWVVDQTKR